MIKIWKVSLYCVVLAMFISCGGSLTADQKEKAKKAIEEGQIQRITEVELTEEALESGKRITKSILARDPFLNDPSFIDSIAKANQVKIYSLTPAIIGLSNQESSLAEAYQAMGDISGVKDNIQKLAGDTLLYTIPIGNERPDGSIPFSHAIAIKMSVKQVVLSISE